MLVLVAVLNQQIKQLRRGWMKMYNNYLKKLPPYDLYEFEYECPDNMTNLDQDLELNKKPIFKFKITCKL